MRPPVFYANEFGVVTNRRQFLKNSIIMNSFQVSRSDRIFSRDVDQKLQSTEYPTMRSIQVRRSVLVLV